MKRLFIIGSGPGDLSLVPEKARQALAQSTDLVAYGLYLDLLGELVKGKTHHARELGEEVQRAELALDLAAQGKTVALISSGDAGIFAMATLVFEWLDCDPKPEWDDIDIEVIPGISAMQAGAAATGAIMGHDFCAISLSDLLTPWEVIEKRVTGAAIGDFVVSFYNPVSRRRQTQLARAKEILLAHRSANTPVVLGRNLTREDQTLTLTTLGALNVADVDMFTLVQVGNSQTRRIGTWVYTPRGYTTGDKSHG